MLNEKKKNKRDKIIKNYTGLALFLERSKVKLGVYTPFISQGVIEVSSIFHMLPSAEFKPMAIDMRVR